MDLAAGTKTSTLNQSVSGRFFARCRRHFTSRSFSKRMIPAGERFPLRDFEIPRARAALRLGDIYISAAGNSIAVHDWPIFISPWLHQPDSSWVIVCASR